MSVEPAFVKASGIIYNLAKQGTHKKAILQLLLEEKIENADAQHALDAYVKEERSGAFRSIITGGVLLIISIALTVITLLPIWKGDYAHLWPWGMLAGAWFLGTGLLRLKRVMTFQRT